MIKLPNLNLRSKLFGILFLALIFGLGAVGLILNIQFGNVLKSRVWDILEVYIDLADESLNKEKLVNGEALYLKGFVHEIDAITGCRVTIVDMNGVVLADSKVPIAELPSVENHIDRPELQQAINNKYGSATRYSATIQKDLFYFAKILKKDQQSIGFLRLALFSERANEMLATARNYFILAGFAVLILSFLLIIPLSHRITRRIRNLNNKAREVAAGNMDVKIDIRSRDELDDLGKSLNEMAEKLSGYLKNMARERQELNTVLSSVKEGIIAIQNNFRIIFFNDQALKLLDYQDRTILEKEYQDIIMNTHLKSLIDNFFRHPYFITDEIEIQPDKFLEVSLMPFHMRDLRRHGGVLVLRDISHYKKLEKIRTDFVANVSHEFKTPLAVIRGYAETMLDWGLEDPKTSRKYTEKIIKQSHQLETLVSDLLQLARIERLQNIEFKAFAPDKIVRDIATQYQELAGEKKISLKCDLNTDRYQILGDAEMFRSIIANLVDNAVKYTPTDGKINISSEINGTECLFSVQDTGIGIPQKEQERIFERFYRVDKARTRAIGSTGLGLSIVKHLAELQNAKLWMTSKPDAGSCFYVKFNLAMQ